MEAFKDIFRATGLPDAILHVLIGLGLYLCLTVALKLPFRSWTPLAVLLGIELLNEGFDAWQDISTPHGVSIRGTALDIVLTMLVPFSVFLLARAQAYARLRRPL